MTSLVYEKARSWTVSQTFFIIRTTFTCGECSRYNRKSKVFGVDDASVSQSALLGSQCEWCGGLNVFYDALDESYVGYGS